jgi:hypothetical protein
MALGATSSLRTSSYQRHSCSRAVSIPVILLASHTPFCISLRACLLFLPKYSQTRHALRQHSPSILSLSYHASLQTGSLALLDSFSSTFALSDSLFFREFTGPAWGVVTTRSLSEKRVKGEFGGKSIMKGWGEYLKQQTTNRQRT